MYVCVSACERVYVCYDVDCMTKRTCVCIPDTAIVYAYEKKMAHCKSIDITQESLLSLTIQCNQITFLYKKKIDLTLLSL